MKPLDGKTQTIKDIIENKNQISKGYFKFKKTNDNFWRVFF